MREENLRKQILNKKSEVDALELKLGKIIQQKEKQDKSTKDAKEVLDFSSYVFKIFTFVAASLTLTTIFSFSISFLLVSILLTGIDIFTIIKFVKDRKFYNKEKTKSDNLKTLSDSYYEEFTNAKTELNSLTEELSRIMSANEFVATNKKNNINNISYNKDSNTNTL